MKGMSAIVMCLATLAGSRAWALGGAGPDAAELVERAAELDGVVVEFSGEAIGEALERGDMAWVNLADDAGALGIWMTSGDAALIRTYGSYATTGDRLLVRGVFHRACPEHGGDMDIHAASVQTVSSGEARPHPVSLARALAAVFMSMAATAAAVVLRLKDGRRKEQRSDHAGYGDARTRRDAR